MTPREKTVIRAIVKALQGGGAREMDSFITSYATQVPAMRAFIGRMPPVKDRAAALLEAMAYTREGG